MFNGWIGSIPHPVVHCCWKIRTVIQAHPAFFSAIGIQDALELEYVVRATFLCLLLFSPSQRVNELAHKG